VGEGSGGVEINVAPFSYIKVVGLGRGVFGGDEKRRCTRMAVTAAVHYVPGATTVKRLDGLVAR
jgi:hypothetical protein